MAGDPPPVSLIDPGYCSPSATPPFKTPGGNGEVELEPDVEREFDRASDDDEDEAPRATTTAIVRDVPIAAVVDQNVMRTPTTRRVHVLKYRAPRALTATRGRPSRSSLPSPRAPILFIRSSFRLTIALVVPIVASSQKLGRDGRVAVAVPPVAPPRARFRARRRAFWGVVEFAVGRRRRGRRVRRGARQKGARGSRRIRDAARREDDAPRVRRLRRGSVLLRDGEFERATRRGGEGPEDAGL